jgi:hexokinase
VEVRRGSEEMIERLQDWLFHRALRLSAAAVKALATRTGQSPARIVAVNDVVASIAAHAAVRAAQRAVNIVSAMAIKGEGGGGDGNSQ